jgi:ubiquinone/menaquinone biosynthesis C-methylase UbiE
VLAVVKMAKVKDMELTFLGLDLTWWMFILFLGMVLFICVIGTVKSYAAEIYDAVIVRMTARWYATVLGRLTKGQRVLDIGIGTASALCTEANAATVKERDLSIVGVDYEVSYIKKALGVVDQAGLKKHVELRCADIYDWDLPHQLGKFDAGYFSGSISLMPDPLAALKVMAEMLKPGGVIYITQTFQRRSVPFLSTIKPLLFYLTTIDFGQLVFEADILKIVEKAEMEVVENSVVPKSVDTPLQVARLLVVRPKAK